MLKLLKQLRKSVVALIAVTILLVLQAACDLSLPTYTSEIVNVGILQSGIESPVPEVIRESELNQIFLLMDENSKIDVLNHYTLLQQEKLSEKQWSNYLKKYPLLSNEALYLWDGTEEILLEKIFAQPIMLYYTLKTQSTMADQMRTQLVANMPPNTVSEDMDVFDILAFLPAEGRLAVINTLSEKLSTLSESMISQTAITYLKTEYEVIGYNIEQMQINFILFVGAKMLALALAATLASVAVTYMAAKIAAKMGRSLRSNVFHKVLSFSNTEMDKFSTASLITRSTNDIQQVQMLTVMMIRIVIYSPILAIGGIIKVLNTNTSMTWILAVGVGTILTVILTLLIVAMPKFKMIQKLLDRINLVMREILTGLPVIRAFSTEEHEKKRFDQANIDMTKNNLFVNRVMTLLMPTLMLIMNLVSILIIWVGADKVDAGTMQVGDMMAFIQYTMQIIMSFLMLTMISIMLPRAAVSAKRIDEILTTETIIHDPETEDTIDVTKKGVLEFQNVSFRYPNAEEDVLSGISFVTRPGETTAIIGSTGCGKSTLINLIPRFYDASQGTIMIDGVDITKIKQHTLRKKLGFVPQKGVLFTGTIESNIKFGKSNASYDEMVDAARIAQAIEFIDNNTEGYQTSIAEGGTNVSGGQKQRLSIARAIARHPEIYIFDDSFSALDYKTDAILRKTLKEELSDSTLIIVAQRISTIMNAEQILVLDDGRIVGKGTHKDLMKNCEVYQQIASSQLSKEELDYE